MTLSFAEDIRPLFRDIPDVVSMKEYGLDLSSYAEVKAQAESIYGRLLDRTMPCDGAWPEERMALFKRLDGLPEGFIRHPRQSAWERLGCDSQTTPATQ